MRYKTNTSRTLTSTSRRFVALASTLLLLLALGGCLESDQFNDDADTAGGDTVSDSWDGDATSNDSSTETGGSDWTGEGGGDWTGEGTSDWTGDGGDWTGEGTTDTVTDSSTDVDEIADVPEEICVPEELTDCDVEFTAPLTSPTAQTAVLVTGSFTGWAADEATGALPLTNDGGQWTTSVHLDDGEMLEYKFLMKWPDGDALQWCVVQGDNTLECANDASNMVQWVECGSTECGDTPDPTCSDNIKNQGEEDVDCGGPCEPCDAPKDYDWRDAVMYFVFVDRFFDADTSNNAPIADVDTIANYQGGDLLGVEQKLEYLSDLGVTALWLTAPYNNRDIAGDGMGDDWHTYSGFHGYWPSPAEEGLEVESHIGDAAALHNLITKAHDDYGMKIVFDYVMNHVDDESPLAKAHPDWFHPLQLCANSGWGVDCWFTDYLPDFDFDNAAARNWSVNDAVAWAKEFDVDGYRLDAIKHVESSWLLQLRGALNQEFPGKSFYLVGETFEYNDCNYINSFVDPATKLDGQFDFPLRARLAKKLLRREEKLGDLDGDLTWLEGCYPNAVMSTFIGNHDLPRSIHVAESRFGDMDSGGWSKGWVPGEYPTVQDEGPYRRLGLAFSVLLTIPGVPLIYYGDEIGIAGGADPDNRRMMYWDGWNTHQQWLHDHIATLNAIRTEHPVLRYGSRQGVHFGWDTYAYKMTASYDEVFVLLNRADGSESIDGIPAGTYTDLLTDETIESDGSVSVPGQDTRVLVLQ